MADDHFSNCEPLERIVNSSYGDDEELIDIDSPAPKEAPIIFCILYAVTFLILFVAYFTVQVSEIACFV